MIHHRNPGMFTHQLPKMGMMTRSGEQAPHGIDHDGEQQRCREDAGPRSAACLRPALRVCF